LSDYIPGVPINDEVKKKNGELPGMGGVFNTVNLHLYHYAGNNPVKYVDPDGKLVITGGAALLGVAVVAVSTSAFKLFQTIGKAISDGIQNGVPAFNGVPNSNIPESFPAGESNGLTGIPPLVPPAIDNTQESFPSSGKEAIDNILPSRDIGDMKKNKPDHPDYVPPKNWNGEKVKTPRGSGWPAKNGDVWVPDDYKGTHAPHWDVQHKDGSYDDVYPKKEGDNEN
jgi:hypothetical protein